MKAILTEAGKITEKGLAGKLTEGNAAVVVMMGAFAASLAPINATIKSLEKQICTVVRTLPIWAWAKGERGIAECSIAAVVALLGDPGTYANPAKVWKRLGLSVTNAAEVGERNPLGSAMKNPLHGYSPLKRSTTYVIGTCMVKSKHPMVESVLKPRRAHTATTHPDWTKGRSNNDGMRIMVKKWLVVFWKAWRFGAEFDPKHGGAK